jgi:TPR repeat protein
LPHGVQYLVASMLAEGRGSEDDAAAAAEILHEAATHGHAEGQYLLGLALRVAGDGASAVRWLSAAAENQYAAALFALGRLYEAGDGVEKDLLEAYVHYGRAAQQGQPEGLERGNAVWPRLTPLQQDAAWERLRAPAP